VPRRPAWLDLWKEEETSEIIVATWKKKGSVSRARAQKAKEKAHESSVESTEEHADPDAEQDAVAARSRHLRRILDVLLLPTQQWRPLRRVDGLLRCSSRHRGAKKVGEGAADAGERLAIGRGEVGGDSDDELRSGES
jgi:hypothetical protein